MFDGLCAFPLTPMKDESPDLDALCSLVSVAAVAGVDSLGVLGSTGNYAYLSREERREVLEASVASAGNVPVLAGVGAVRTRDVLALAGDAQTAGAAALLLAPVSYQRLTDDEVFGLYDCVAAESDVPVVVYDNPGTTGFVFSDDLRTRIAGISGIRSIKLPPPAPGQSAGRIAALRKQLPPGMSVGISGDWMAAEALLAGFDIWYSVIAGLLPSQAKVIVDHVRAGRNLEASEASAELEPLWDLFRKFGSLRVVSALAEEVGLLGTSALPLPLRSLDSEGRDLVAQAVRLIGIEV